MDPMEDTPSTSKLSKKERKKQRNKDRDRKAYEASKTDPTSPLGQKYLARQVRKHQNKKGRLEQQADELKREFTWSDNTEQVKVQEKMNKVESMIAVESSEVKKFKICKNDGPFPSKPEPSELFEEECLLAPDELRDVTKLWLYKADNDIVVEDFKIKISGHDYKTLCKDHKHDGWLNDNIVDFYLQLLAWHCELQNVYCFYAGFHKRLLDNFQDCLTFRQRHEDFLQFDLYLMPVIMNKHWSLVYYSQRDHKIGHLNSLGSSSSLILDPVIKFFGKVFHERGHSVRKPDTENHQCPQQTNGSDCGVYVCSFARCLTIDRPLNITPQQIMHFRKQIAYEVAHTAIIDRFY
ncbi:Sentrin-specific protease 2-like protein [Leptotrombidium deliense]|uniref:Sentrin-specific protease 2-like protein n=1 Tax=Leptotrombidium deliense TaxID=299467 RepID=A0A443S615_9ACAR|nr:Sentrin-specific protease 2-like protein [Leptotrombidium deliense]